MHGITRNACTEACTRCTNSLCACAGLSYTTFSYSDLTLNTSSIGPCGSVQVSVTVRNTGTRAGDEVGNAASQTSLVPVELGVHMYVQR